MYKNGLYLLIILVTTIACNKSKNRVVEAGLEEYVDRFFEEAAVREMDISDDNLEVVFRDLSDEGVCGLGYFRYQGTDLRKVEISSDVFCWDFNDDLGKESLVFHELGHAILRKTHTNATMPNGLPSTIMCDGQTCNLFGLYDKYTLGKRKYYIDKLFANGTFLPDWGRLRYNESPILVEDFEGADPQGEFVISDSQFADNFSYEIVENLATNSKRIKFITQEKISNGVNGNWVIKVEKPNIKEGTGIRLSANVTTEALEGQGVTLILKTFSGQTAPFDLSAGVSNRSTIINGTAPSTNYHLDLDYFPSAVQYIEMTFQVLPNTSGIVYLDDFNLTMLN